LAYVKLEDEKSLNEALKDVERVHLDRKIKIIRAKPLSERPPRQPRAEGDKEDVKPKRVPREPREKRLEGDKPRGRP
jgi:hypothetical protein